MSEFNVWGTRKSHVCEGYCVDCEREGGKHYMNCPHYPHTIRLLVTVPYAAGNAPDITAKDVEDVLTRHFHPRVTVTPEETR